MSIKTLTLTLYLAYESRTYESYIIIEYLGYKQTGYGSHKMKIEKLQKRTGMVRIF